jgi:hypothetical protein
MMLWIMSTKDHIFIFGKDKKMSGRCVFEQRRFDAKRNSFGKVLDYLRKVCL